MPCKDALASEVSLDLTSQELLALPVRSRMEGGDDIRDIDLLPRAERSDHAAAAQSDSSVEIELSAEEMVGLLEGRAGPVTK